MTPTYLMPAEWETHAAMWLAWPHNREHWLCWIANDQRGSEEKYEKVLDAYCQTMHVMQESEAVHLLVLDKKMEETVLTRMQKLQFRTDNLKFFYIKTNVPWIRDHGPIFVRNKANEIVITDWIFNAWGGKYPPWEDDDAVPIHISKKLNMPIIQPGIVLEGGSIDVNGKGTLLTTSSCLLNKNRNPHLTKKDLEKYFHDYLDITNTLWLGEGIINDDTDGHVDDLARFVNPTTIVCVKEENPADPNYKYLKENFEQLQTMKDQDGKPLNIVALPMPDPVIYLDEQTPASYANFYIGNKIVLMPTFRQPKDEEAKNILQKYFPDRKVIGVDSYDVIWGQGSWHCLSQQQPS